ncbi:molybdopterin dinucleotide binding domain-containing protein, partial [Candidatus Poribacteria bacterium]
YVVVNDQFFTPTARYGDIVFPICTDLERADLVSGQGNLHYNKQAVKRAGQTQTDYWVFARLAERLGFGEAYTDGKSETEWLEHFLAADDLDAAILRRDGIMRSQGSPPTKLAEFREDPVTNPLTTPSGLIEITCSSAEEYGLPIIPSHIGNGWDGSNNYPLRLVTPHSKLRANSSGYANPWLQRLDPHVVWVSSQDAEARRIEHGDQVEVFNQYGTVAITAKVTERIMPGTVCIYQGVWYRPGKDGVDEGGCANVLTGHHLSATGGMAVHSEWVEVRRKEA